jgi:peroxiredoxin
VYQGVGRERKDLYAFYVGVSSAELSGSDPQLMLRNLIPRERFMKRRLACILVTSLLLALASTGTAQQSTGRRQRQAPDFTLNDWQGKKVPMSDFRGKVVLLQFFQSACSACQLEAPFLEHLYGEYQNKGMVVVGISHDAGGAEAVKRFASEFGITYPLLIGDLEVAVRYIGITPQHSTFAVPRYFLIDGKGTIVREFLPEGQSPEGAVTKMEQAIKDLLAPRPTSLIKTVVSN